jgi:3-oxoacyl-[acyl-carrier protein] reductase
MDRYATFDPGLKDLSWLSHFPAHILMRATQQDFSGRLVHTCYVCPGVTATPMVSDNKSINNKFLQDRVSFGRLVDPDEIAKFIYYCSSTPIVNGSVLHANLGQINT